MYCIGIDVAKFKHSAAVLGKDGRRLVAGFEFSNDEAGFSQLVEELRNAGAVGENSAVCLEATGHYGRNLVAFLEARDYRVFEVNPLLTSNWRKAMSVRKVKNDSVDAEALALWLHAGNPVHRRRAGAPLDDLRSLTRHRFYVSRVVGDCKRKAVALIDVLVPEFHGFFSDDFCKTAVALLERWPGHAPLAEACEAQLAETMRKASRGRFGSGDARRLKELAALSVGQSSEALGFQLKQLLGLIAFAQGQLASLDEELGRAVEKSLLLTIPGIGVVCAAGIHGEIGDISRFANASKLVAFAGSDPSVYESGEFEGTRAHLSKRGSPYLRWYLWVAAERTRRFDPALGAYYEKKRQQGKCHKVAVSAVVRKLCAIIFAVLRDGKPYECRG